MAYQAPKQRGRRMQSGPARYRPRSEGEGYAQRWPPNKHQEPSRATLKTELAARRTGMALFRTHMSAERTLMAVIRTALALIGFGFTIFQFFHRLKEARLLPSDSRAPQRFGELLVGIGILMVAAGIRHYLRFMHGLGRQREVMVAQGLVRGDSEYPMSMTLFVALALLLVGVLTILDMLLRRGLL